MRASELKRGGALALALSVAALLLGGYAAFGRARAAASPAPAACTCDDQALRRDVEALSRRLTVVTAAAMAPRGVAPKQAPAAAALDVPSAAAPASPAPRVEAVEVEDGVLVAKTRMPDGTIVVTRSRAE